MAKAVVELGESSPIHSGTHCRFYNVVNPKEFSWTADLLPALKQAGLFFEAVAPSEWLNRLRQSEQDPSLNPSIKLMNIYDAKYGVSSDIEAENRTADDRVEFATDEARKDSEAMRNLPDIVQGGYIKKFVERWVERW